jgi:catechol 2,3-dioxygenase-like lactoylglutathione lyase family enzyme
MISHISLGVASLARSLRFYDAVFGTLGYKRLWETAGGAGYGLEGKDEPFAVFQRSEPGAALAAGRGFHLAFTAPSPEAVDAFFAAALAHGGEDDGPPGLRPRYGPGYYAAFVRDPDGHKIEAVFHGG